jgi:hypothetical protein
MRRIPAPNPRRFSVCDLVQEHTHCVVSLWTHSSRLIVFFFRTEIVTKIPSSVGNLGKQ